VEKNADTEPQAVAQRPATSKPDGEEARVNGKRSGARTASDEQFKRAHRKTRTLHAGLFRRLAE
jgi:hypothetical protein